MRKELIMKLTKTMLIAALTFVLAYGAQAAQQVQLSDLPKDAQDTIKEHANGRKIARIEREEQDGKTVYTVCLKGKRDRKETFKMDSKGQILQDDSTAGKDQSGSKQQL
jgi:hypothetical protein